MEPMERYTNSAQETEALGQELVQKMAPGTVIAFSGDLGAGKAAFVRGMARGGICAVEWSENILAALEPDTIYIDIRRGEGDDQRIITVKGMDE